VPDANASKSGAALLALAGMTDAKRTADEILKVGGPVNISTFYGFYVLQAPARPGLFIRKTRVWAPYFPAPITFLSSSEAFSVTPLFSSASAASLPLNSLTSGFPNEPPTGNGRTNAV